ncbi:MAG: long-chain-fatty-acid--CoA ligase [Bryobacterales bacterium]|nr:long-chain-fatty-acid--CoA ligase [Bryobacterales bacterium]MBV9400321.1 long-chain-fatty-acid--CoA ligase [Bryobacterales bacterium]
MFIPLTPLRCLHRAIDIYGSKIGIVSGDRAFTYREFGTRAERLASGLTQMGIAPGDRIAFLSFNNHQLLEGYYGVIQAGAIVMPLNVRLTPVELTDILRHSGARMMVFENDFSPIAAQLRTACPNVEYWVSIDACVPPANVSYEQIVSQGRPGRAGISSLDETSIAELFYTSGSTGTPKGVALSHRTLYLHALSVALLYDRPETMVELHTIPLFHANGWGRPQVSTMLGVKQVMVRRFDPVNVLDLVQLHRATDMCVVPTMAQALMQAVASAPGKWDTSTLRRVMIGGAASSPELVERMETAFPGCECMAGYGLTETSPVATTSVWKGIPYGSEVERVRRQAMAGWPIVGTEVRVVDAEMRDVPRDAAAIGEVVVRGDQVMDAYFHEPEATRAVMTGDWFHTGDMAVWDEESYINIIDRKKEIIISGGENISSIEVEKAIASHPAVLECAVVAAPDDKWGEVPAAIVLRKPGATLTEDELRVHLEGRLGRFKIPRIIEFHDDPLPKTGTGKIRKLVLREKYWTGKEKRVQG